MIYTKKLKNPPYFLHQSIFFIFLLFVLVFNQDVFAGVFDNKKKNQHQLTGAELNRIKAEHQLKFGNTTGGSGSFNSNNPWEKKKQKNQAPANKANWGECRDYALHKRNRCYREGRDAYRCEQLYETRSQLCDNDL